MKHKAFYAINKKRIPYQSQAVPKHSNIPRTIAEPQIVPFYIVPVLKKIRFEPLDAFRKPIFPTKGGVKHYIGNIIAHQLRFIKLYFKSL